MTNRPLYEAGPRARGSLTVWFTAQAIEALDAAHRNSGGVQPRYSALAITTALTLRGVFRLAHRQTEGLIASIIGLLRLNLAVPDHSTISRWAETLEVPPPRSGREPLCRLVDSTGLNLCGSGVWLVQKHVTRTRRGWRKLHLANNADTARIVASALTDKDANDGSRVGPLLDQVDEPVGSFTGDALPSRTTSTPGSLCGTRWPTSSLASIKCGKDRYG